MGDNGFKRRTILWAGVFAWLVSSVAVAQEENPPLAADEVADLFSSSVVLVQATTRDGSAQSGSGFFVSEDGLLATSLHVLDGAVSLAVVAEGTRYENVAVRAFDVEGDLAVLAIRASTSAVVLGDTEYLEPGERLYAIGNPLGLTGTISEGLLSAWREPGRDESVPLPTSVALHSLPQIELMQFSASISPGSSGGPVFDQFGLVVGVVTGTVGAGALDLNFAVPIERLHPLVEQDQGLTLPILHEWVDRQREQLADPHLVDARYYFESEAWTEALESLSRALGIHPRSEEALLLHGALLIRTGRFEEAEAAYREATLANPDSAGVWAALGSFLVEHRESRAIEATQALERALEIDPWRADAAFGLGVLFHRQGNFGGAQQMWERAVEIDGEHLSAHLQLGRLFLSLDDVDAAESSFRDALWIDRDSADAHLGLAIVYERNGEDARSQRHLDRFKELGGEGP